MWTVQSAAAAFSRAMRNTTEGKYEDALRDFERLLEPAPKAYQFFLAYQHSYVILGAKDLATLYPPAQIVVDEWLKNNPWPF